MTAQIHERLILDGEETTMASCPPLPRGHPRLVEGAPDQPADDEEDTILRSTACWRRYQGVWEIREGRLYLVNLRGRFRLGEGGPIFAEWFSGTLRIPRGGILRYVHMGFETVYEQELLIEIDKGVVAARRVMDNRETKRREAQ